MFRFAFPAPNREFLRNTSVPFTSVAKRLKLDSCSTKH